MSAQVQPASGRDRRPGPEHHRDLYQSVVASAVPRATNIATDKLLSGVAGAL